MFDWDRDHDETVAHRPIPVLLPPPQTTPAPRGWQGQWLSPIAAAITLLVGVNMISASEPPPPPLPVSIAVFGGQVVPERHAPAPRVALQVLDEAQAARFARGLARFDTPALIAYAAVTERDMSLRNQPLRAELADALTLIRAEIARRSGRAGG